MNDNAQGRNDTNSLAPMIGFALGALAGGAIALLLAPASGEDTRRRLTESARRMTRDGRDKFDQTRDAATQFGSDVKSAIDAGREAFRQDGGPKSRIAATLDTPPARTP